MRTLESTEDPTHAGETTSGYTFQEDSRDEFRVLPPDVGQCETGLSSIIVSEAALSGVKGLCPSQAADEHS